MTTGATSDVSGSIVLDKATIVALLDPDDSLHHQAFDLVGDFWYDGFRIVIPATILMELFADAALGGSDMVYALSGFVRTCVDDVHPITAAIAGDAVDCTTRSPGLRLDLAVALAVGRAADCEWFVTTSDCYRFESKMRVAVVGREACG